MFMVAPSQWLAARARESALLKGVDIEVIPNGVDTTLYSPGNKSSARTTLKLPHDRKIILFGGKSVLSDPNKGADLLWNALEALPLEVKKQSLLVVFGEERNEKPPPNDLDVLNYGVVDDEAGIVDLYRASDVLAITSRQENLPNMIAEGMSCGLPCVAFSIGGIPEQIRHRRNGCLVEPFDVPAMSSEISWLLASAGQDKSLAAQARDDAVEKYSLERIAQQHIALYERVVNSSRES
jgi:glycosyltransferase involved in cell wall biosynthesis